MSLYKSLFKVPSLFSIVAAWEADRVQQEEDEEFEEEKSEGFWTEFFLLKCHAPSLRNVLEPLSPDDLLHLQVWLLSQVELARGVELMGVSHKQDSCSAAPSIALKLESVRQMKSR